MDELKPSPRNEFLFSLAQKLREAPGALSRANPILGTLARSVLGDIPQGLEHYAYGDSPLGPPANAPMVDIKKAAPMLEATPLAALGALPKGAAMMVPAMKLNQPGVATRLAEMLKNRASADEVWRELGMVEVPAPASARPFKRQFMQELSDEGLGLSENIPRIQQYKLEQALERVQPIARESALRRAKERSARGELLADGTYKMGDVFKHPAMYDEFPQLRDATLKVKNDIRNPSLGAWDNQENTAILNPMRLLTGDYASDPVRTTIHEATHALQGQYGYMGGSSPGLHATLKSQEPELRRLAAFTNDPIIRNHIFRTLRTDPTPFKAYQANPGEIMARESERRIAMPPDVRSEVRPGAEYHDMFDQPDMRLMNGISYLFDQKTDHKDIAKKLREWGSLY